MSGLWLSICCLARRIVFYVCEFDHWARPPRLRPHLPHHNAVPSSSPWSCHPSHLHKQRYCISFRTLVISWNIHTSLENDTTSWSIMKMKLAIIFKQQTIWKNTFSSKISDRIKRNRGTIIYLPVMGKFAKFWKVLMASVKWSWVISVPVSGFGAGK